LVSSLFWGVSRHEAKSSYKDWGFYGLGSKDLNLTQKTFWTGLKKDLISFCGEEFFPFLI